jgi:hypothetical protein
MRAFLQIVCWLFLFACQLIGFLELFIIAVSFIDGSGACAEVSVWHHKIFDNSCK